MAFSVGDGGSDAAGTMIGIDKVVEWAKSARKTKVNSISYELCGCLPERVLSYRSVQSSPDKIENGHAYAAMPRGRFPSAIDMSGARTWNATPHIKRLPHRFVDNMPTADSGAMHGGSWNTIRLQIS
jgi:hypothetical protein